KSSFINSVLNSKVAKTSSTPGKTRSINYYKIDSKFYFVDLPGFGYAKVSKRERDEWKKLLRNYFALKRTTQVVFHIIDSRHEPMQSDFELNEFIHSLDLPYFVFLNKVDKLNQKEAADSKRLAVKYFPELIFGENLFYFSAVRGNGRKETIGLINRLLLL
ncbi:MAG: ribosome biogenesis GTP-binding protein YihA/YsxC, partial [Bacteroidota bacterium]